MEGQLAKDPAYARWQDLVTRTEARLKLVEEKGTKGFLLPGQEGYDYGARARDIGQNNANYLKAQLRNAQLNTAARRSVTDSEGEIEKQVGDLFADAEIADSYLRKQSPAEIARKIEATGRASKLPEVVEGAIGDVIRAVDDEVQKLITQQGLSEEEARRSSATSITSRPTRSGSPRPTPT